MQTSSSFPAFKLPPAEAGLDDLLALAGARFEVEFEPVRVGDIELQILQLRDMEGYLERLYAVKKPGDELTLPFWARIWPTSVLLGYYAQSLDPANGSRLLEIGAGVGICGLFAAKRGFDVLLTDNQPEGVLFTRINILKNGLAGKARAKVADFTTDKLGERFDYIFGSEVLYQEEAFRPLVKFILKHLADTPCAEAVLARNFTRKAPRFLNLASRDFLIAEKVIGCKGEGQDGEKHLSIIHRLKARKSCLNSAAE